LTNFPTIFWALLPPIIFLPSFGYIFYIYFVGTQKWVTTIVAGFWAIIADALSAKTANESSICFGQEWGWQHGIRPINFRKKRRRRRSPACPFFWVRR
jgi:hypothetical protein